MGETKGRRLVGLGINHESGATCVTLKAAGDELTAVLRCARKHGVPVVFRSGVCDLLGAVDLDDEIPQDIMQVLDVLMEEIYRDLG